MRKGSASVIFDLWHYTSNNALTNQRLTQSKTVDFWKPWLKEWQHLRYRFKETRNKQTSDLTKRISELYSTLLK